MPPALSAVSGGNNSKILHITSTGFSSPKAAILIGGLSESVNWTKQICIAMALLLYYPSG
jgi:hypothetical protein